MRAVVWPGRKCRQTIYKGDQPYNCEVEDMHPGPCASFSDAVSHMRRDDWEKANPNWRDTMKEAGGAFE